MINSIREPDIKLSFILLWTIKLYGDAEGKMNAFSYFCQIHDKPEYLMPDTNPISSTRAIIVQTNSIDRVYTNLSGSPTTGLTGGIPSFIYGSISGMHGSVINIGEGTLVCIFAGLFMRLDKDELPTLIRDVTDRDSRVTRHNLVEHMESKFDEVLKYAIDEQYVKFGGNGNLCITKGLAESIHTFEGIANTVIKEEIEGVFFLQVPHSLWWATMCLLSMKVTTTFPNRTSAREEMMLVHALSDGIEDHDFATDLFQKAGTSELNIRTLVELNLNKIKKYILPIDDDVRMTSNMETVFCLGEVEGTNNIQIAFVIHNLPNIHAADQAVRDDGIRQSLFLGKGVIEQIHQMTNALKPQPSLRCPDTKSMVVVAGEVGIIDGHSQDAATRMGKHPNLLTVTDNNKWLVSDSVLFSVKTMFMETAAFQHQKNIKTLMKSRKKLKQDTVEASVLAIPWKSLRNGIREPKDVIDLPFKQTTTLKHILNMAELIRSNIDDLNKCLNKLFHKLRLYGHKPGHKGLEEVNDFKGELSAFFECFSKPGKLIFKNDVIHKGNLSSDGDLTVIFADQAEENQKHFADIIQKRSKKLNSTIKKLLEHSNGTDYHKFVDCVDKIIGLITRTP